MNGNSWASGPPTGPVPMPSEPVRYGDAYPGASSGAPTSPPALQRPTSTAWWSNDPQLLYVADGPPAPDLSIPEGPGDGPGFEGGSPTPGWGWRSLVAFVAGGLLVVGGFMVAQMSDDSKGNELTFEGTTQFSGQNVDQVVPNSGSVPTDASGTADSGVLADTAEAPATASTDLGGESVSAEGPGAEPAAFVAETLGPSVVQVQTSFGVGSGVVYKDGLIITNNHVVEGAQQVSIRTSDGRTIPAEVVGTEPIIDVAVVSVSPDSGLVPAKLALDGPPKVGQTVTEGIVSAVNRPIYNGDTFISMIQTDAPINPGNSGGALANRYGQVMGINTAIQTDGISSSNAGVGFAIPIDRVVHVADLLVQGLPIERGFLGVKGRPAPDGSAGIEIIEVTPSSPAQASGLQVGDRIVAVDSAPVTRIEELVGVVGAYAPGDSVVVDLIRGETRISVDAVLAARPDE